MTCLSGKKWFNTYSSSFASFQQSGLDEETKKRAKSVLGCFRRKPTMQLILVRHAEAVGEHGSDEETDFARALTEQGKQQAANLAEALRLQGVKPGVIACSPLVRAKQTAEALWSLLPAGRELTVTDALKYDALRPRKLSKQIVEMNDDCIVLVGHMPDLGIYAAWLLGAGDRIVKFEKGAAASFTTDDEEIKEGSGELDWFVTPAWCAQTVAATSR